MLKLAELVGRELKWIQPHTLKMDYELRAGDLVAATLSFPRPFDLQAIATAAGGSWTFEQVGFWKTKVIIRASGAETDLAVFKNNAWNGGGTLELPDGRKYLASSNFWSTRYEFKTEMGEALIRYTKIGGMLHMSSMTEIQPLAKNIPELPWMVSLGWYLTVMIQMEAGAAATAAS